MTENTKPKRFYKKASGEAVEGGLAVHLDGRPVRPPLGRPLVLPTLPLAKAVVAEWQAQGDEIIPASMPLCGYANTAIDRVGEDRQTVFDTLIKFADTDLLCYRADQPDDLVKMQLDYWQPIVDWAEESLGVEMQVTTGVLPVKQSEQTLNALKTKLSNFDNMELTAVASLAAACGSMVIALAVSDQHINADHAFKISQLDENFQSERWGQDAEAVAAQGKLRENIISATLFLSLLRQ